MPRVSWKKKEYAKQQLTTVTALSSNQFLLFWVTYLFVYFLHDSVKNVILQSSQVEHTPQVSINEFIIQKLILVVVVDFRFISAFLHV